MHFQMVRVSLFLLGLLTSLSAFPAAPTVTTSAATGVTGNSATLGGSAIPNGSAATGFFRYSTTDPVVCDDTFGMRVPLSGGSALGSGYSPFSFDEDVTGLSTGTPYYFCAIATNGEGAGFGSVLSFTILVQSPSVSTNSTSLITGSTAQLNGSANPNGDATTGWFRYATTSPGTCNDFFGTRAPASGGTALGSGTGTVAFSEGITGLTPGTTYYSCAIAANSAGASFGSPHTFLTPLPPTVTSSAASNLTMTTARLNGLATPNGSATTGYFRYSTTDPVVCDDTFGTRVPFSGGSALGSGYSPFSFDEGVAGLSPGTTYYFCAIATNGEGAGFGSVLSFLKDVTGLIFENGFESGDTGAWSSQQF